MLRPLSHVLADVALTLDAGNSLEEMLRLVVEQTRELVEAEICVAHVALDAERSLCVGSSAEPDGGWVEVRHAADPLATAEADTALAGLDPRGGLSAPLTTLDGRRIGSIHVLDKRDGEFTQVDDGMLVHLAQMASAAIERASLYRERH